MDARIEAMWKDDQAPSAPLGVFLAEYERDDNIWWRTDCGHHMNLFEEAVEKIKALEKELREEGRRD